MGGSLRCKYEPDIGPVVDHLLSRSKGEMSKAEADAKARSRSCARHVRTYSRSKEEMKADLTRKFNVYVRLDQEIVAAGGLPLLNPEVPAGQNGPLGAATALKNLLSCIDKGCCSDPKDVDGM